MFNLGGRLDKWALKIPGSTSKILFSVKYSQTSSGPSKRYRWQSFIFRADLFTKRSKH